MYWPKVLAETMISTTLEVPAMVSSMMGIKCFLKCSWRYTNLPMMKQYSTATAPPSAGVNRPKRIPRMMPKGKNRPQKEMNACFSTSLIGGNLSRVVG